MMLVASLFFALYNTSVFITHGRFIYPVEHTNHTRMDANDGTAHLVSECHESNHPSVRFYSRRVQPLVTLVLFVVGPFFIMLISSIVVAKKLTDRRRFLLKSSSLHSVMNRRRSSIFISQNNTCEDDAFELANNNNNNNNNKKSAPGPKRQTLSLSLSSSSRQQQQQPAPSLSSSADQRLTMVLMFVAAIEFLLTATPAFFLEIAEHNLKHSKTFSTPHGKARFQLVYTSARLLLFSNFALHFVLFCLSAQTFRRSVKSLLCPCSTTSPKRYSTKDGVVKRSARPRSSQSQQQQQQQQQQQEAEREVTDNMTGSLQLQRVATSTSGYHSTTTTTATSHQLQPQQQIEARARAWTCRQNRISLTTIGEMLLRRIQLWQPSHQRNRNENVRNSVPASFSLPAEFGLDQSGFPRSAWSTPFLDQLIFIDDDDDDDDDKPGHVQAANERGRTMSPKITRLKELTKW